MSFLGNRISFVVLAYLISGTSLLFAEECAQHLWPGGFEAPKSEHAQSTDKAAPSPSQKKKKSTPARSPVEAAKVVISLWRMPLQPGEKRKDREKIFSSQKKLAQVLNISRETICDWLKKEDFLQVLQKEPKLFKLLGGTRREWRTSEEAAALVLELWKRPLMAGETQENREQVFRSQVRLAEALGVEPGRIGDWIRRERFLTALNGEARLLELLSQTKSRSPEEAAALVLEHWRKPLAPGETQKLREKTFRTRTRLGVVLGVSSTTIDYWLTKPEFQQALSSEPMLLDLLNRKKR